MNQLPILWIDNFHKTNFFTRRRLRKIIDDYHTNNSFFNSPIDKNSEHINYLYQKFLKVSSDVFGNLHTDTRHYRYVSCFKGEYENMKVRKNSWWHIKKDITIDSIYFLDTPENGISFLHKGIVYDESPKRGDLLIFPPNLIRAYTPSTTKKCRYSINMGIKIMGTVEDTFQKLFRLQQETN